MTADTDTYSNQCTLSNAELIEACSNQLSALCESSGRKWTMRVPVDFNRDSDMLFSELIRRFQKAISSPIHAANAVFNGCEPLGGAGLALLDELLIKHASDTPTIEGML